MPTPEPENTDGFDAIFAPYPSDKTTHHTYGVTYDRLYPDLIARSKVTNVLEIGVYHGGSMYGWRDFFPNARITGIDVNPDYIFQDNRIHTALVDANDMVATTNFARDWGPFDLIVDDGPHDPRSQLSALLSLWEHVKPGGHYVIEDILADKYYNIMNYYSYFPGVLEDFRHISNIRNDVILTLTKGA